MENKVGFITRAAGLAKLLGDRKQEANFLGIAYKMEKEPSQNDLYNWGYANYQAGDYAAADSIFCDMYQRKFADQIYGYLWCARSKQAQDTTMEQGLAVEAYKQLAIKSMELDSVKYKAQAIAANFYLVSYYNDIAKSKDTAVAYTDKVLEIDPANADAIRIKGILTKPPPKAQPKSTATKKPVGTKPKAKSGASAKK